MFTGLLMFMPYALCSFCYVFYALTFMDILNSAIITLLYFTNMFKIMYYEQKQVFLVCKLKVSDYGIIFLIQISLLEFKFCTNISLYNILF